MMVECVSLAADGGAAAGGEAASEFVTIAFF